MELGGLLPTDERQRGVPKEGKLLSHAVSQQYVFPLDEVVDRRSDSITRSRERTDEQRKSFTACKANGCVWDWFVFTSDRRHAVKLTIDSPARAGATRDAPAPATICAQTLDGELWLFHIDDAYCARPTPRALLVSESALVGVTPPPPRDY